MVTRVDKKITPEMEILLLAIGKANSQVIQSYLSGGGNAQRLLACAEMHRLTPLLYRWVKDLKPDGDEEILQYIGPINQQHTRRNLFRHGALISLCHAFEAVGIGFFLMKGSQLSHWLYGDVAIRCSVDMDIYLTNPNTFAEAAAVLRSEGYHRVTHAGERNSFTDKVYRLAWCEASFFHPEKKLWADIHIRVWKSSLVGRDRHHLFPGKLVGWEYAGFIAPVPNPEAYFVYLSAHAVDHMFYSLHWLADLVAFRKCIKPRFEQVLGMAQELRKFRHMVVAFMVTEKICQLPAPAIVQKFFQRSYLIRLLVNMCIHRASKGKPYEVTIRARVEHLIFKLILARSLVAVLNEVLALKLRLFYRAFFRK